MNRQRGAGLFEVSIALLLVALATLGLARALTTSRELGALAQHQIDAIRGLRTLFELERGGSEYADLQGLVVVPGAKRCIWRDSGTLEISIAWPETPQAAQSTYSCAIPTPPGWHQLAVQTTPGTGW
ncbi:hypothetical protein BST95_18370 [Halioglobus japonicus]|uniref:Uncharacterized protein n=1 Tax=Halioglobus japonicus TaxID=930805 RepID=A0AAP8MBL5_9GAMM|nr:hypothetical protein BST95_18370 [Halioglobus japonicus]PLW84649.1 hypothetical protein C0029_18080 [Halioglobus japonicus]